MKYYKNGEKYYTPFKGAKQNPSQTKHHQLILYNISFRW